MQPYQIKNETIESYVKLTKPELIKKCKELNIRNYSNKKKKEIIEMIAITVTTNNILVGPSVITQHVELISETLETLETLEPLKFVDLFCGIGGFHQALNKLNNTKCILACDIDKKCREVYYENHNIMPIENIINIKENEMDDFDILCAGFPCFVSGTKTLTTTGYKNIEDVKITDVLYTHKGKFQNILNLQSKIYCGGLIELNLNHHTSGIISTKEHPYYVREKNAKGFFENPCWKNASELTLNDYIGMVINTNNIIPEFTFETDINIKLDKLNYWFMIGYLLGSKQNEQHIFSMNNTHFESKSLNCSNFIWWNILKKFGIYDYDKIIPEWVHDAPTEFIKEFINGYVESCYHINNNTTLSYNLAYGMQRLYLKVGYIYSINKCIVSKMYIMDTPNLKIKQNVNSFIDDNYVWFEPLKISNVKTSNIKVFNFEVENDNSYIIENVCVHNCQPFSNGGKKKTFQDKRGLLFDEIIRIAKEKKPKFMFLENVKHILKVSKGEVLTYIKSEIHNIGYNLQLFTISPHDYGIPQQRERIYFVCIRNDIYNGTVIKLPCYTGEIKMENYLDKKDTIDKKYFISGVTLNVLEAWDEMIHKFEVGEKISPTILINDAYKNYTDDEFNNFPNWKKDYVTKNKPLLEKYKLDFDEWYSKNKDLMQKREIYGKLEWQTGMIKLNDSIFNHFIQIRQSGIRVKRSKYFPTLVAISQIPIYGKEKRYITPRECARLQSFPDTFILANQDKHSYKQLGNSVNVDNVFTIISSTLKHYGLCILNN
jgi:DNA (cytosine-5)-methyltransferase 1